MISGYFLMGREGWYRDRIFHILKKMVIIWGITNIVYYSFIQFIFTEYDSIHNLQTFIQTLGIEFIFGGEFCGPLWYITAYIWALIIIYIFNIKRNRNTFLLVAFLLLVNVLLGSYSFILPFEVKHLYFSNNFLTSALPFVLLGGFLKQSIEKIQYSRWIWFLLVVLCYIELGFLYIVDSRNGDVFLMTPVLCILIFSWFVNHPNYGQNTYLRTIGKKYSLYIYLLHTLVIWLTNEFCKQTNINFRNLEFLIVLPITILISIIIYHIINLCVSYNKPKYSR